ncbi:MAG: DUF2975 domain-containing protein [Oscillospiraceae bacterium]|jgi:hypothetical protein
MDWNENKSVRLSQACVVLFAVCLLLLDCLCYFAVRWFTGLRGMPWQTGKLMMLTIYLCSVFGWILLWKLWRLLANIRAQVIFDARNVALLRAVSWCCVGAGLICLVSGVYYLPFAVIAIAAGFMALIVRIVKNVFRQAILMKDDLDLTI